MRTITLHRIQVHAVTADEKVWHAHYDTTPEFWENISNPVWMFQDCIKWLTAKIERACEPPYTLHWSGFIYTMDPPDEDDD